MSDTGRRYPVEFRRQMVELVRAGRLSERAPASSLRLSRYRAAPRSHVNIGIRASLETR